METYTYRDCSLFGASDYSIPGRNQHSHTAVTHFYCQYLVSKQILALNYLVTVAVQQVGHFWMRINAKRIRRRVRIVFVRTVVTQVLIGP
jgi:hypothetical protein